MEFYIRMIHRVSQSPEKDTLGPFTDPRLSDLASMDLRKAWRIVREHLSASGPVPRLMPRRGSPRHELGGAVFFVGPHWHSVCILPIGTDLYCRMAPPSHGAADKHRFSPYR